MLKRLRASGLDNSHDTETRQLLRVDALVHTGDEYQLIVERGRAAATVVASIRAPIEWLGQMADAPCWPSPPSTGSSRSRTSSRSAATLTGIDRRQPRHDNRRIA
jgi:hypothetical protein